MPSTDRGSGWRRTALQALGAMLLSLWLVPADPRSSSGSGKLLKLEAFSGKMHGAAALDTDGDRKTNGGSSAGLNTRVERPGGGRRILWRQIQ